ncbi:hypothetical protein ACQEVS_30535 [Streptomyces sp. CA-181903]|uniref:hypothetical protein n=1 Tax=Streptomyces sp. CA-181903 TaxID=3240055 RepID=UPI003D929F05
MRLRHSIAAALGALALLVTMPTSADAATGTFEYTYGPGVGLPGAVLNPVSGRCYDAPGATEEDPAHSPKNLTNATATVFLDFDCSGDVFYVMNPGKILGDRLKFRSVIFS